MIVGSAVLLALLILITCYAVIIVVELDVGDTSANGAVCVLKEGSAGALSSIYGKHECPETAVPSDDRSGFSTAGLPSMSI